MRFKHLILFTFFITAAMLGTLGCEEDGADEGGQDADNTPIGNEGGDADVDGDSDTDADTDPPWSDDPDFGEAGSDSDSDADGDVDGDTDSDTDSDADSDSDGDSTGGTQKGELVSYIWIANSVAGTLSKINTETAREVGRYWTCPVTSSCDPSRTSVNVHGDMVVTNRQPTQGPASVTKFAAEKKDCKDRNGNGQIDTSKGPKDVLPWGEDECMLWNTPIGPNTGLSTGARATAWDGSENPDTGEGGHIYVGSTGNIATLAGTQKIFKLDGDEGKLLGSKTIPGGAYGGAVDGKRDGTFWYVSATCPITWAGKGKCMFGKVDMNTLDTTTVSNTCGYGISIDGKGRIWTAGGKTVFIGANSGCVQRYDPKTDEYKKITMNQYGRGVAVDGNGSVWAALTGGDVIQVDQEKVTKIKQFKVGKGLTPDPLTNSLVGMAVDYAGFVWAVSQGESAAHKIDPKTYKLTTVPVGKGPYTYSDMTGVQLRLATGIVVK